MVTKVSSACYQHMHIFFAFGEGKVECWEMAFPSDVNFLVLRLLYLIFLLSSVMCCHAQNHCSMGNRTQTAGEG